MSRTLCVLLITFSLFLAGQPFRLSTSSNDKINEGTIRRIQSVFIKRYPQAAIDKYISVVRQLYSQVPEERKEGNFESVVLLVEGALYQTEIEREMLTGNLRHYDVRNALKRVEEASDSNADSEEFSQNTIAAARKDLDKEFPVEVGEMITNIFDRVFKSETLTEARRTAIQLTILSMDGARVVTGRTSPRTEMETM